MIPAIRSADGTVRAVMSGSADHAAAFAAEHQLGFHTADLDRLLEEDVQAVYISSTNEKHFIQTQRALNAGKHVMCEKPMALNVDEAAAMVQLADERGLILAINHHLPGNALHRNIREIVASGAIGTVLSAQVSHAGLLPERLRGWRLSEPEAGSGVILDLTCHDASVLNPLLGTPTSVTAIALNQADWNPGGGPDTAMAVIEYTPDAGVPLLAQTLDSFAMDYGKTYLSLQGTKGSLHATDAMTQDSSGTVTVNGASGSEVKVIDSTEDPYVVSVEGFHGAVCSGSRPTVSGRDGLLALKVALAAQESAATGRTVRLR
jgi:1,5-anhydro-D-fructose reductase (1,5-anhydro-D-mannitol-forming)